MKFIWCKVVRTWQTWLCPCILIWLPLVMSGVSQIQKDWTFCWLVLKPCEYSWFQCLRLQRYISMSDKQLLEPQCHAHPHLVSEPSLPAKGLKATNERMLEALMTCHRVQLDIRDMTCETSLLLFLKHLSHRTRTLLLLVWRGQTTVQQVRLNQSGTASLVVFLPGLSAYKTASQRLQSFNKTWRPFHFWVGDCTHLIQFAPLC